MALHTANGEFRYDNEFNNKSLHLLVSKTYDDFVKEFKWKKSYLPKGSYGYDNIAMSIAYVIKHNNFTDINSSAEQVHLAWSNNYKWWKNVKPYILLPDLYKKPKKNFNDSRRNKLSMLSYSQLSKKDKNINYRMANIIINNYFDISNISSNEDSFID